jgi:Sulfotransferase domain
VSRLPNFLVIGAMKAGTTSLHAYLNAHPDVHLPGEKELDFFVAEKGWKRGRSWYESQFDGADDALAVGEASPNYTKFQLFGGVPERIRELLPDARLIYVLRDPIERMRSHYVHNLEAFGLDAPIGTVLLEDDHYRLCSSYALQLEQYLAHFPREQILVLTAEDLRRHPERELRGIFAFLGVDPDLAVPGSDPQLHRSADKRVPRTPLRGHPGLWRLPARAPRPLRPLLRPLVSRAARPDETALPPEAEARLRELLRPDVARVRSFLGPDFDGWGIA